MLNNNLPRTPEYIDSILNELKEHWKEHPHLRLCQLIYAACVMGKHSDIFPIEDVRLIEFLQEFDKLQNKKVENG